MELVRINASGFEFIARFESERAPQTCAKFRTMLPYKERIIHVRWSGEGCWIPLGELDLGLGGDAEGGASPGRLDGGLDDLLPGVAEQQRSPRLAQVDVSRPIGVFEVGTFASDREPRCAADRPERPNR